MKMQKTVLFLLTASLLLTGCGKGDGEKSGGGFAQRQEDGQLREAEDDAEEAAGENAPTEGEASKTPSGTYPRELENRELQDFTIWINQGDDYGNYGFLLSEYEKPQDVDLNEVFYAGAGLDVRQLSSEEEAAYLKAVNEEEIYTEISTGTATI